jgi:hypothetical protein
MQPKDRPREQGVNVNRFRAGRTTITLLATAIACALAACDDPRSASEQIEPWVDKSITLAPQGARALDHALVFTTNLEFVVVKKLEEPRTVCNSSSEGGGTEMVQTEALGETEVQLPGEPRTICEEQDTMDVPRVSRVTAIVRPKRAGAKLDPESVHELVLGFHAKDALREALATRDFELASHGREEIPAERPATLERLHAEDDTLISMKASGLRLNQIKVQLGDGARFQPGDEITIDAVVEQGLGGSTTTLGTPIAIPQFKSEENPGSNRAGERP